MSTISYEQRETKLREYRGDRLQLIYEWSKTGVITFGTFKKLLEVHEALLAKAIADDSY